MEPLFRSEGEVVGGQRWHVRKSDVLVSCRLSIVTVALSVTIRPKFAIECLRRSNQQGVGHLCPNLVVFPFEQTGHDVGVAKSVWRVVELTR